jgi:adenosylcobyric acid synthase
LDIETSLSAEKRLGEKAGVHLESGEALHGYEIHLGVSEGPDRSRPFLEIDGAGDGARSADGRIEGCYLHGLMRADGFRHAYLSTLRARDRSGVHHDALVDKTLDGLAAHLEDNLDLDRMLEIAHAA